MLDSYLLGHGGTEGHGEHGGSAQDDEAYTTSLTVIADITKPPEKLCISATL